MNDNLLSFEGHDVEVFELNGLVLFNPKHVAECLDIVDVKRPSVSITFVEGITLKEYLKLLADKTELDYDTILKEINNQDYLKTLLLD